MNLHVNKALISAMASLNMTEDALLKEREYTIIEFFRDYLKLPLNETIDLSKDLVNELPVVCINEWDLTRARTTAANIGNAIKASSNGTNPQGNAITYPKASNPISRMGQSVGNAFGSKMSTINNSPMIRVGDASGYKFLTFPDLDASRKGHDVILNKIVAGLTTSGKQAEVVKVGSNEWNTAKQSKELVKVEAPNKNDNNKANVIKVLDDLNQLVAQKKAIVNKYSFMSPEELADIQAEIQTKVGGASATLANAVNTGRTQETTSLTQAANQAISTGAPTNPGVNPAGGLSGFYQAGMTGQQQPAPAIVPTTGTVTNTSTMPPTFPQADSTATIDASNAGPVDVTPGSDKNPGISTDELAQTALPNTTINQRPKTAGATFGNPVTQNQVTADATPNLRSKIKRPNA